VLGARLKDHENLLGGPLFTTAQQELNRALGRALAESGHEVWLPQEHEPRERTARAIFDKDLEGLNWAEVVVANLDGPDPDSGTCWECSYAFMNTGRTLPHRFPPGWRSEQPVVQRMMSESVATTLLLPLASAERIASEICRALARL